MPEPIQVRIISVDLTYTQPQATVRIGNSNNYVIPINPEDIRWWGGRVGQTVGLTATEVQSPSSAM